MLLTPLFLPAITVSGLGSFHKLNAYEFFSNAFRQNVFDFMEQGLAMFYFECFRFQPKHKGIASTLVEWLCLLF